MWRKKEIPEKNHQFEFRTIPVLYELLIFSDISLRHTIHSTKFLVSAQFRYSIEIIIFDDPKVICVAYF